MRSTIAIAIAAAVLALAPVRGQEQEDPGLRLFVLGNSLTDNLDYAGFKSLVEASDNRLTLGSTRIPGAPIGWLWGHPDHGFSHNPFGRWPNALKEYQWDAITLQPFLRPLDKDLEKGGNFLELARNNKSPDIQLYIYAQWVRGVGTDYTQLWLQDVTPWLEGRNANLYSPERTAQYYESLTRAFRTKHPDAKPALMIPSGHVFYLLDQKIKAGMVPGYDSIFNLYSNPDSGGGTHIGYAGEYLNGCTWFATLYGQSPVGLPIGEYDPGAGERDYAPMNEEVARIFQQTAWEVVATHPLSGVTSDEPLKVVSPRMPEATAGEPFRMKLLPAFGTAPYEWSLASGELPAELELEPTGRITGMADAAGTTEGLTFRVEDAEGATAEKTFDLTVVADDAPEIATDALPPVARADYFSVQLRAVGGNGSIVWKPVDEELPTGLTLTTGGILQGSPGQAGTHTVKVEATDSDARDPESDTRELKLEVGPAGDDVLFAQPITDAKVDGELTEAENWNLAHTAEKVVQGQAHDNTVRFDVRWDENALRTAVKVQDQSVTEDDRVTIYLDAYHNRENQYNFDDRRIVVNPNTGRIVDSTGVTQRIYVDSQIVDDGYVVEVAFNWRSLPVDWRNMHPDIVFGFDVGNTDADEGEPTTEVVWMGSAENETVPQFGTIILGEE